MAIEIPGLILSRRVDEVVLLLDRTSGAEIARVTVAALHPARVKLHFAAGYEIDIQRLENLEKQDAIALWSRNKRQRFRRRSLSGAGQSFPATHYPVPYTTGSGGVCGDSCNAIVRLMTGRLCGQDGR